MIQFIRLSSVLSLILFQYLVQSGDLNNAGMINLRLVKLGRSSLICKANRFVQVKILAESKYRMTQILGRIVRVNKPGHFLVLCYVDFPSQNNTIWIKAMYRLSPGKHLQEFDRNVTQFLRKSFRKENDLLSDEKVKIRHRDTKTRIHYVYCSYSYPFSQDRDLQLFRIGPDGIRSKIPLNVQKLSYSYSFHRNFITMKYKHKFLYSSNYFRNKFECRTTEKFSLAYKTSKTAPIIAESKCGENLQVKKTAGDWRNFNEYVDPETTSLQCSCPGAYPRPNIYWVDSVGNKIKSSKLKLAQTMKLSKFHCCVATQTFQSGKKHSKRICKFHEKNLSCQKLKVLYPSMQNGLHQIKVNGSSMRVYCDMESPPHAWILVQRRLNGKEDFAKNWINYRNGFGDLNGEFWLGNEKLHQLTSAGLMKIRFDLWNKYDNHKYAEYSEFFVGPESDNYRLTISGYSGTAVDAMSYHNNMQFSTRDRDNDKYPAGKCTSNHGSGGWWYKVCCYANPNGKYINNFSSSHLGCFWFHGAANYESLKKIIIKIAYK